MRSTLASWCCKFNLAFSGTIPILTVHLIDFSVERGKWEEQYVFHCTWCGLPLLMVSTSLTNGVCHKHRGPQSGHKKSLAKQSNQHREHLFDAPTMPSGVVHALPTEASMDHWMEEEISAVLPWVSCSMFCCHGSCCTTSHHLFRLTGLWKGIHIHLRGIVSQGMWHLSSDLPRR